VKASSFCYGDEESGPCACTKGHSTTANQSEIRKAYFVSVITTKDGHIMKEKKPILRNKIIMAIIILIIIMAQVYFGATGDVEVPNPEVSVGTEVNQSEEPEITESSQTYVEYTFRNKDAKWEHYEKHGIEMGFESADDYEAAASAVVNNPASLHKLEAEDNDDVYYLEETNEFVIVSTYGYIRTYFKPDRGKAYFDAQ